MEERKDWKKKTTKQQKYETAEPHPTDGGEKKEICTKEELMCGLHVFIKSLIVFLINLIFCLSELVIHK